MSSKPHKCPNCGSERVASILYGLPMYTEELEKRLEAEEVIRGGCDITDDDPLWHCVECQHRWGWRDERLREELGRSQ
jgi:primosomal protein N'